MALDICSLCDHYGTDTCHCCFEVDKDGRAKLRPECADHIKVIPINMSIAVRWYDDPKEAMS